MVKKKVDLKDPVEIEYSAVLTPYALSYVSKQLSLKPKVTIVSEYEQECHITSPEGVLKVTVDGCHPFGIQPSSPVVIFLLYEKGRDIFFLLHFLLNVGQRNI